MHPNQHRQGSRRHRQGHGNRPWPFKQGRACGSRGRLAANPAQTLTGSPLACTNEHERILSVAFERNRLARGCSGGGSPVEASPVN